MPPPSKTATPSAPAAAKPGPAGDRPYLPGDPIPTPEALERNTDSAWALFNHLQEGHERGFADTQPPGFLETQTRGFAETQPADAEGSTMPLHLMTDSALGSPPQTEPLGQFDFSRVGQAAGGTDLPPPEGMSLDDVVAMARAQRRICPLPAAWRRLYALLPDTRRTEQGWQPPLPLDGQDFQATPTATKRDQLRFHLQWADRHGALPAVAAYLQALPEAQWLHLGE